MSGRCRGLGWLFVGLWIVACEASHDAELEGVLLLGQRAILVEGQQRRWQFDREKLPVVRIPGDKPGAYNLRWNARQLATVVKKHHGFVWLRSEKPMALPPRGHGALTLVREEAVVRTWPVTFSPAPADHPIVGEAIRLREAGRISEALALLDRDGAGLTGWSALWTSMERGRCFRLQGAAQKAIAAWAHAADLALALGAPSIAAACWRSNSYVAAWHWDLTQATTWIERAAAVKAEHAGPVGALKADYYRGWIAQLSGDFTSARRLFVRTMVEATNLGDSAQTSASAQSLALVYQQLGRLREALKILDEQLPPAETAARSANTETTRAWIIHEAMQRNVLPRDDERVARAFESAYAAAKAAGDQEQAALAGVHRGWLAFRSGAPKQARQLVEPLRPIAAAGVGGRYLQLLDAELLASEGKTEQARLAFEAVEKLGGTTWDYGWRAALGRARLWRSQGKGQAAVQAYLRAVALLEEFGRHTTVRDEMAWFFSDRFELFAEATDVLVEQNNLEQAFLVADAGHARVIRAWLDPLRVPSLPKAARQSWQKQSQKYLELDRALQKLSSQRAMVWRKDAVARWEQRLARLKAQRARAFETAHSVLREHLPDVARAVTDLEQIFAHLPEDHAVLVFAPGGEQTHSFWLQNQRLDHALVQNDPALGLGKGSLAPWRQKLPGLGHLYVVAGGHEPAYALGQLSGPTGAPLAAELGISMIPFASLLCLPLPERAAPPLVVADPNGDLPWATKEGQWVTSYTGGRNLWREAATPGAVVAGLQNPTLFHFAGHGRLRGMEPWDAHLVLHGGQLSLEKILMRRTNAALVVLNGCDTGSRLILAGREVIGLPEAFLAAGSTAVLATQRAVQDTAAARFVRQFYLAGGLQKPGIALQKAIRWAVAKDDDSWRAFELWGRSHLGVVKKKTGESSAYRRK